MFSSEDLSTTRPRTRFAGLIGRVTEAKTFELEKQAVIEPAVDLTDLSDVFIVGGMKGTQVQK